MSRMTREQWLQIAAVRLARSVRAVGNVEPPENIRFSVGFPKRKRGRGAHAPGAGLYSLHMSGESTGGMRECFISPAVPADTVGAVLMAALIEAGQGRAASADDMAAAARAALAGMPPYPHDAMTETRALYSAQGSRMLKAACPACGYTVRITRKWANVGLPACPADGAALVLECDAIHVSES